MADQTSPQPEPVIPSAALRSRILLAVLAFCGAMIAALVAWGDPSNSLHQSALAWAWTIAAATIFGALLDQAVSLAIITRAWERSSGGK